jgi:hypothetical protein
MRIIYMCVYVCVSTPGDDDWWSDTCRMWSHCILAEGLFRGSKGARIEHMNLFTEKTSERYGKRKLYP